MSCYILRIRPNSNSNKITKTITIKSEELTELYKPSPVNGIVLVIINNSGKDIPLNSKYGFNETNLVQSKTTAIYTFSSDKWYKIL